MIGAKSRWNFATRLLLTLVTAALALMLVPAQQVYAANTIESIEIEAELQPDGSALITDHRVFHAEEGTEHYISIGRLGESEITDFEVLDEHRNPLENEGEWDVDRSIDEKAGKSGIVDTGDGVELCFGIGELGRREFTIKYRVTNFVRNLTDGPQAIYWQFLNPDMDAIDSASVRVTNSFGFSYTQDNTRIWGFGYEGQTEITSNALVMQSGQSLGSRDYMVLLAILPANTVTAEASYDYDAAGIEKRAKEGSDWGPAAESGDNSNGGNSDSGSVGLFDSGSPLRELIQGPGFMMLVVIIVLGIFGRRLFPVVFKYLSAAGRHGKVAIAQGWSPTETKLYYRQVPHEGPIIEIAGLMKFKTENWIAAALLEWVRAGHLQSVRYDEGKLFVRERDGLMIHSRPPLEAMPEAYGALWNDVVAAAGADGVLGQKEMYRYYSRSSNTFRRIGRLVQKFSTGYLKHHELLEDRTRKVGPFTINELELTPAAQQIINNAAGFRNYLKDFSLMSEREAINVHLWDAFMVWAAFLGIADRLREQFTLVDPTYESQSSFRESDVVGIAAISSAASRGYNTAVSSESSSSGGGGGSSSSGGGGGASGGGSGGGTR